MVQAIVAFAWQVRNVVVGAAVAPKGADTRKAGVDFACEGKAVIPGRGVGDPLGEPVPQHQGVVSTGQRGGEARGEGETEVKADQGAAMRGLFGAQGRDDPCLCNLAVAVIDRCAGGTVPGKAGPDGVLFRGRAAIVATGPIDHDDRVEGQSPTCASMKSAMAVVSSRSKTGRSRSSGVSEATAVIVGSPGAIRALPVAARCASILGWVSRL